MEIELEGFIFKSYAFDHKNQLQIIFYGRSKEGPFKIILDKQKSYFFTESNEEGEYVSLNGKRAKKIAFKSFFEKNEILKKLKGEQILTFEADIKPAERYLMDNKIYGGIKIKGSFVTQKNIQVFVNPIIIPFSSSAHYKIFSFDIETSKDGRILSLAYHALEEKVEIKKVLMLGTPQESSGSWEINVDYFSNEQDLLRQFEKELQLIDPDLIIGWNVIAFDLQFIFNRCEKLNLKIDLGREKNQSRIFVNGSGDWQIDIAGRVIIDGPRALKMNFFSFESYKLNEVAKKVLNETKDIDEDEVFDKWGEIERRFRDDKKALAIYNLKDAVLVTEIFLKTKIIDLLLSRSTISGMLLERVGGSTAAFDHFFLPELHQKGFVAPNVLDVEYFGEAKGGFVISPVVGIHENVIVVDFKSLYPTIIRTFFIDPLSRLRGEKNSISTPVGIIFSQTEHILPHKIDELLEKRKLAKIAKDENLSMAIKILMNSFYGVLGSSGCRFYHPDLPKAITETGQWVLKTTIEFLESEGFKILYGDTDSLFVKMDSFEAIFPEGKDLVFKVNHYLKEKIMIDYRIESKLEIQFDKVFRKMVLTSIRSKIEGAKKRYAGLVVKSQDKLEEELMIVGMEFVRSDWSRLARDFQYDLILKIFYEEDLVSFISDTIEKLERGELNHLLVMRKRLTRPLSEYTKTIPPHVRASRILEETMGIKKKRAEYLITKRGAMPIEFKPIDIDFDYYIEKQLAPIAESLLPLVNLDWNKIRNKQLSLF